MESAVFTPCGGEALYMQLYKHLVNEISTGRLKSGEKLPSKRRLAQDLQLAVNTVDTAYQMLVAEGYVLAKPKSGFFVQKTDMPLAKKTIRGAATSEKTAAKQEYIYNFETSSIDTALFPYKTWRRIQRDIMAGSPAFLNHGARQGDENLREAISAHLHEYRGAQCTADQIIVGAGIEYLLSLLARMFNESTFAVENPGYARTHRILENNGASVEFVPLDESGLSVDALEKSGASLAYVTPSHQFPAGITMPIARRTQLLSWADNAEGRYIIEDDYDSEFRFDTKPVPCLQGLGGGERVIYISTFSKSIAPAFRIGYMVLPQSLLSRFDAQFGFYSSTVSRFEQQTLAGFMSGGYYARHLNRLRIEYRQRRDVLLKAIYSSFGRGGATVYGSHTGLHLLLQVHGKLTEQEIKAAAKQIGIHLNGLSEYYENSADGCLPSTVVLGYAGMTQSDIENAVALLAKAVNAQKS